MSEMPLWVKSYPWHPDDGPPPTVTTWPPGRGPALYAWDGRRWRYSPVLATHAYRDGHT